MGGKTGVCVLDVIVSRTLLWGYEQDRKKLMLLLKGASLRIALQMYNCALNLLFIGGKGCPLFLAEQMNIMKTVERPHCSRHRFHHNASVAQCCKWCCACVNGKGSGPGS